jgi:hypothetical protein
MAAAFVQAIGGHVSGTGTLNVSLTGVGGGNHLTSLAGGYWNSANLTLTAATSSPSATWSQAQGNDEYNPTAGNYFSIRADYSENVASGSWTVTQHSNNSGDLSGVVVESSGVKTSSSLGLKAGPAHVSVSSTAQPGSITPTAGSILFMWMADDSGNILKCTVDSGFTAIPATDGSGTCWDGTNSFERVGAAYKANVPASAVNPTFTESSGTATWNLAMIEFLASGAAANPFVPPIFPEPIRVLARQGFEHSTDIKLIGQDKQFRGAGQWTTYDYPNPRGYPFPIEERTWLHSYDPKLLLGKDVQFRGAGQWTTYDWPNPRGYPFPIENRTWLHNLQFQLIGKDTQFRGPGQWTTYDYPNPRGYARPVDLLTHLNPGLQVVVVLPPIFPSDWPNPRGYIFPVELRTWVYVPSPGALQPPFAQTDWPNPVLAKPLAADQRTWLFTFPPGVLLPPFAQYDWPIPRGAPFPSDLRTFVNGVEIQLIGQDKVYGAPGQVPSYDWPNPRIAPNQIAWLYDVHGVFVGYFPAPAGGPPLIYLLHSGKWAKKITNTVYIEIT